jgi:prepilin-type N-terminal cleavage/methylation domain-containing protein
MCPGPGEKPGVSRHRVAFELGMRGGFTLVELLVVISIISLLMGILSPALIRFRLQARSLLGTIDQSQVVKAVLCYAVDNDDFFPQSVATIGPPVIWNWSEPTTLTGIEERMPGLNLSISAYLRSYISNASVMSCRNAPREHEYLQDAWDAGDDWRHPDLNIGLLTTTYCFYWNYTGFLGPGEEFNGPSSASGRTGESQLMMSCYFGYDHHRSRNVFSSCEKFRNAGITEEMPLASAWYWSAPAANLDLSAFKIRLHAAYSDGHVSGYSTSEVAPMEVILHRDTGEAYAPGAGPGVFFLPEEALR